MADKTELTFEENKNKDVIRKIICTSCGNAETNHQVVSSYDVYGDYDCGGGNSVSTADGYEILKCKGCDAVSFRHSHWFSESCFDEDDIKIELYPKRGAKFLPIQEFWSAPASVKRIYHEVIETFNNENYTLCAAGLRGLVEAICADKKIIDGPVSVVQRDGAFKIVRKKTLDGKISGLHEKNILTETQSSHLHEHRFLGNEALHEMTLPPQKDLLLAIEIIQHVIDVVYELPEKAIQLKKRRNNCK